MKTATDVYAAYAEYLEMLDSTPDYAASTEILYGEYVQNDPHFQTAQETPVAELSKMLDAKIKAHTVSYEDSAAYEEAARCAGFYAGFRAGAAYIHFLQEWGQK